MEWYCYSTMQTVLRFPTCTQLHHYTAYNTCTHDTTHKLGEWCDHHSMLMACLGFRVKLHPTNIGFSPTKPKTERISAAQQGLGSAKGQSIRALRVDFKLTLGNSSVPRLGRDCAVAPYPT
eukprot:1932107-Rhodomonas_salina.1